MSAGVQYPKEYDVVALLGSERLLDPANTAWLHLKELQPHCHQSHTVNTGTPDADRNAAASISTSAGSLRAASTTACRLELTCLAPVVSTGVSIATGPADRSALSIDALPGLRGDSWDRIGGTFGSVMSAAMHATRDRDPAATRGACI